jgi:AcrR family transcriptional regulator
MRERKRQERHDTIVDAAMALFQRHGYEQTTMEEIAAEADVSAPTLYRYFPKKSQLLVALFWKERERLADALDAFHKTSADWDAPRAVAGLLVLNNSGIRSRGARKLWREAIAALMRMHDEPNDEFRAIKQYFERHIERMLRHLQRESRIAKDAPIPALIGVLYAIAAENYYRMIANEFRNADEERQALEAQVRLVLKGWVP